MIFDLIYLDGDHDAFQVAKDLDNAWNCLSDGGVLILMIIYGGFIKILKKIQVRQLIIF